MDIATSREGRRDGEEGVIVPTAAAPRSVEMLVEASWELTEEGEAPGCSAEGDINEPCRHSWASGISGESGHE